MHRFLSLVVIACALSLLGGCAALKGAAAGAAGAMGGPQSEEVELTMSTMCPQCSQASQGTLNPFPAPVKYTKVGIPDVDSFVESANNVYGTVMVVDKMVALGGQMTENPNMQVEGFTSKDEVMSLAKTMFESASGDVPNLITQGQSIVTDVGKFASDPKLALAVPAATEQLQLSIERLNEAQGKLTEMAGSFAE